MPEIKLESAERGAFPSAFKFTNACYTDACNFSDSSSINMFFPILACFIERLGCFWFYFENAFEWNAFLSV